MPRNFFITGMPKSGKTTLLSRIADELRSHGLRVGGFVSPEEKEHGTRTGFYIRNLDTGELGRLAEVDADGPKVSKYHVDIKSFENAVLQSLERFERYDVIVIDEIGRMELKSQKFSELLDRIVESPTPLIASLHNDFVERYGQAGEVVFLDPANREQVYNELVQKVKAIGKKATPKAAARKAQAKAMPAKRKAARKAPAVKKARPAVKRGEAVKVAKKKGKKEKKERGGREEKGVVEHLKELLGF
ncbi:MAG: NTPase [Candidatus ainarchaeum sp.]|nr:NTPase [Candidatus ainarchaeum sp.]